MIIRTSSPEPKVPYMQAINPQFAKNESDCAQGRCEYSQLNEEGAKTGEHRKKDVLVTIPSTLSKNHVSGEEDAETLDSRTETQPIMKTVLESKDHNGAIPISNTTEVSNDIEASPDENSSVNDNHKELRANQDVDIKRYKVTSKDDEVSTSSEDRLVCRYCHKVFSTHAHVIRHERIHTGEKPFKCPYCDRRFNQRGNLNVHLRIHTGERPYQCRFCHKSFTTSSYLHIHERGHIERLENLVSHPGSPAQQVSEHAKPSQKFHFPHQDSPEKVAVQQRSYAAEPQCGPKANDQEVPAKAQQGAGRLSSLIDASQITFPTHAGSVFPYSYPETIYASQFMSKAQNPYFGVSYPPQLIHAPLDGISPHNRDHPMLSVEQNFPQFDTSDQGENDNHNQLQKRGRFLVDIDQQQQDTLQHQQSVERTASQLITSSEQTSGKAPHGQLPFSLNQNTQTVVNPLTAPNMFNFAHQQPFTPIPPIHYQMLPQPYMYSHPLFMLNANYPGNLGYGKAPLTNQLKGQTMPSSEAALPHPGYYWGTNLTAATSQSP